MKGDALDPKALIREAYNIEGISAPECRSVFLDWALSHPEGFDTRAALIQLLERHASGAEEHPMTQVLRDGLQKTEAHGRRGGRQARLSRTTRLN
ncbi:MAG: hypothetical protein CSA70_08445 [Rhodobacterales bacterium]|nr:MAG: hypothetical protein CSA70_08445 [Rhodobacterales bacterium]